MINNNQRSDPSRAQPVQQQHLQGAQGGGNQSASVPVSSHNAPPILSTSGGGYGGGYGAVAAGQIDPHGASLEHMFSQMTMTATRRTHASAKLMFNNASGGIALKVDDIKKALQPLDLEFDDLLNRFDEGRISRGIEKFPTGDPDNPYIIASRRVLKARIDPANLSRSREDDGRFVDTAYSITPLTLGAVANHYNDKYNIDIRNISLESEVPMGKARDLGVNIGQLFASQNNRRSMGVSVGLELNFGGPHQISIALYKLGPETLAIVVHDSEPGYYQAGGHEDSVNQVLMGIDGALRSFTPQLSTSILDATDRSTQCDYNGCSTISVVVLKELLMNEGRAIQGMVDNSMKMDIPSITKQMVNLPPSIARITQDPSKISPQEKSSPSREGGHRTVQDKLDQFSAPGGVLHFSTSTSAFPSHWSRDDVTRSVTAKGYNQYPEPDQDRYVKVQADPQNAYLRAKSLAYAKVAIDTVSQDLQAGSSPKERLQSMLDRITIE